MRIKHLNGEVKKVFNMEFLYFGNFDVTVANTVMNESLRPL